LQRRRRDLARLLPHRANARRADEIAAAFLFLASPAASFITGVALPVEGGAPLGYRWG
jgi:NAD(P)-dependent dehydrogenase (short-subunit alcohol dehydrogenase family)